MAQWYRTVAIAPFRPAFTKRNIVALYLFDIPPRFKNWSMCATTVSLGSFGVGE